MTPLVLLPGMMCDARLFGPQIGPLSAARAIQVAPLGGHDTMDALAAEVLENAPPRFALAGLSMGGIVAMAVVARSPERVAALALLDTNPLAEADAMKARRAPQMAAVRAGRLADVMRDELKPLYLGPTADRSAILDLCMEMALGLGPDVFVRQSIALRDRPDRTGALSAYAGRTLVLCGREDRLCPVERHEMMAGMMPNARLEVIDGAGHLTPLEAPEAVLAALRGWLADV